jgi:hypothetical protein
VKLWGPTFGTSHKVIIAFVLQVNTGQCPEYLFSRSRGFDLPGRVAASRTKFGIRRQLCAALSAKGHSTIPVFLFHNPAEAAGNALHHFLRDFA